MKKRSRSLQALVEEQCQKWQVAVKKLETEEERPVVTISRQPGSKGRKIASLLAKKLGFDFISGIIIDQVAKDADVRSVVVKTFDEQPRSFINDLFSMLEVKYHFTSDEYSEHLVKMITALGKVGNAVILGRGSNFILSGPKLFRVRIVAPLDSRIKNVIEKYGVSEDEAKNQMEMVENNRFEFVDRYFQKDIADPINYDLLINTEKIDAEKGAEIISSGLTWK